MRFPTVVCDICDRPVDKLVQYEEPDTRAIVLRAHCHGEMDEMRLTPYDLVKMTRDQLDQMNEGVGRAFTTKPTLPLMTNFDHLPETVQREAMIDRAFIMQERQKETPDLADRG